MTDGMAVILVTGASGFVGRRLVGALLRDGHTVLATSRDAAAHDWPAGVQALSWSGREPLPLRTPVGAVVNLAGASIGGKRWNKTYKQEIRDSRIEATQRLAESIRDSQEKRRPRVLVQASAIGYYGRDPVGPCREDRAPGDDFLATVVRDWEAAAQGAPCRVVRLRFGHILGPGGLLERLRPIYRARLGGPMGSGRQGLSWVHIDDVVAAICWAIDTEAAEGAYNLASPQAVTQREFSRALGRAMGVFEGIPLPGPALRLAAGGIAPYLLGGQTTPPDRLLAAGFTFQRPELAGALADALRA